MRINPQFTFLALFITIVLILATMGCSDFPVVQADSSQRTEVDVKELDSIKPLMLDHLIDSVRCVFLSDKTEINHVDRIYCSSDLIYILDRTNGLFIFSAEGALITKIVNVSAFDIYTGRLYTYNHLTGLLRLFDLSGKFKSEKQIGFRGIDFAVVSDHKLVFYTAGLLTEDKESVKFELAFVSLEGHLLSYAFPLAGSELGINYGVKNRFSRSPDVLTFIPTFGTGIYSIKGNHIVGLLNFSFGKQSLSEQAFQQFNTIENYNFFPFVLNIENKLFSDEYAFFSCTMKGMEGYFFVDIKTSEVIAKGIDSYAGTNTLFNNIVPQALFRKEFVSVASRQEFSYNFSQYVASGENIINPVFSAIPASKINKNKNPVLIFYTIKRKAN